MRNSSNIKTALNALEGFSSADFDVRGDSVNAIELEFKGQLANRDVSLDLRHVVHADVFEMVHSGDGLDSDYAITVSQAATGGTFSFDLVSDVLTEAKTVTVDYNATAEDFAQAVNTAVAGTYLANKISYVVTATTGTTDGHYQMIFDGDAIGNTVAVENVNDNVTNGAITLTVNDEGFQGGPAEGLIYQYAEGGNYTLMLGGAQSGLLVNPMTMQKDGFTPLEVPVEISKLSAGQKGAVATNSTVLRNVDLFWDNNGNFLLEDPQTITLKQGDGTRAAFTLFADDTIADMVRKIDEAIAHDKTNFAIGTIEANTGLGQGALVTGEAQFAYFMSQGTQEKSFDNVEGTIVINSAVTGSNGEIKFVGNEDIIKALSLNTIRAAKENQFIVNVYNAHNNGVVAENVQITNNSLIGAVHSNVDVEFDAMANVAVIGDRAFTFEAEAELYQTMVHLADNTMIFHIGANPFQDIAIGIADIRAKALGINNLQLIDQKSANDAIQQIDNAVEIVSTERSKLGASQNRLEHTINNLMVSAENLKATES